MNNRRKVVVAFGASVLAAPFAFAQQQGKVWRVGFLSQRHVDFVDSDYYYGPFRQGMRELGYVEGKNRLSNGALPKETTSAFRVLQPSW